MAFKDELNKRLPKELKESPEFNILLSLVSKEDIGSPAELDAYLDSKIKKLREWLDKNKTAGTISDERRKKTHGLEFFETIKREVMRYL